MSTDAGALPVIEALQEGDGEAPGRPPEADDVDAGLDPEAAIRCAACGHVVTHARERIEVHGSHDHRRANEHGFDFHIGCFARAPGCFPEGVPTLHWTWFPGWAWQVAGCKGCGEHLGWRFTGERELYGLILPRLRSDG